ncbi:hypothetical protein Tco_0300321 [Tanacetum coccineum]
MNDSRSCDQLAQDLARENNNECSSREEEEEEGEQQSGDDYSEEEECSSCKVFGHIHEECPKNTGAGEKNTVKKPSLASRGVSVGLKLAFKPQKEYRPVTKKPNTSSSGCLAASVSVLGHKPRVLRVLIPETTFVGVESRVLIPETTFVGVESRVLIPETTFVGVESRVLIPEMTVWDTLVYPFGYLRIPTSGKDRSDKGYGTNSLLEQWRDSYPDNDDYDPYNDDMYENHDLSEHLQSICDDFDIKVRDRKKK